MTYRENLSLVIHMYYNRGMFIYTCTKIFDAFEFSTSTKPFVLYNFTKGVSLRTIQCTWLRRITFQRLLYVLIYSIYKYVQPKVICFILDIDKTRRFHLCSGILLIFTEAICHLWHGKKFWFQTLLFVLLFTFLINLIPVCKWKVERR